MTTHDENFRAKHPDVRRPLVLNEIEPRMRVDRSVTVEPHECSTKFSGGTRCDTCFGPLQDKHYPHEHPLPHNVEMLGVMTKLDLSAETVLRNAYDSKLVELVVLGTKQNGKTLIATTIADIAPAVYLMQRGIHRLVVYGEEVDADTDPEPDTAA